MDKKVLVLILVALAVVAVAAIASSGGSEDKKEAKEPDAPATPVLHTESIALDRYVVFAWVADGAVQLKAEASPSGSSDPVSWKSSDERLSTVDGSGKVTIRMWGPSVIAAESGGHRAECLLVVNDPAVSHDAISIEAHRLMRVQPMSSAELAAALEFYGYSHADAVAESQDQGDMLYYAEETVKRLNARGALDRNGIVAEMVREGWPEDMAKDSLWVLGIGS